MILAKNKKYKGKSKLNPINQKIHIRNIFQHKFLNNFKQIQL